MNVGIRPAGSAGGWLLPAALVALVAQSGCSPYRVEQTPAPAQRDVVINPPPSARGNPPMYEVLGRRYYVEPSSVGYRRKGTASWYGRDFHGLSTASGETYDMYALTAAHKTLPIPTWVEVTHLRNGKRVIVKINDRGPFVDDRLIDLSYGAAQSLGMVSEGTAMVEVRALGAPAVGAQPQHARVNGPTQRSGSGFSLISEAAAATPGTGDRPMRRIYVQVGAFSDHGNATKFVNTLQAGGYDQAFIVSNGRSGRSALHRVRIGPLADIGEFDDLAAGLSSLGVHDPHLVVEQ